VADGNSTKPAPGVKSFYYSYSVWSAMNQRCSCPELPGYRNYGGRGLRVCERWRTFEFFFEDMGERPKGLSIERIDNERGYDCGHCEDCRERNAPPNCRWATMREQSRNKRTNTYVVYKGERCLLVDLAARHGISAGVIRGRLRLGWTLHRSLTQPVTPGGSRRKNS
jgi:hypothetical protein